MDLNERLLSLPGRWEGVHRRGWAIQVVKWLAAFMQLRRTLLACWLTRAVGRMVGHAECLAGSCAGGYS